MGSVKRFNLKRIKQEYNCSFFFETGTWKGDSVAYAAEQDFVKIFSSEIIPEIADRAAERFKNDKRVKIICDNSINALKNNLLEIDGNCVFWLDAHFPGSEEGIRGYNDETDESLKYPLKKELEVIAAARQGYEDVILIDDLRIYEKNNYRHGNMPENIIRPGEKDSCFVEELFGAHYDVYRSLEDEGYIYVLPKAKKQSGFLSVLKSRLGRKVY